MKIFMKTLVVLLWIGVILICWMTYFNPIPKFFISVVFSLSMAYLGYVIAAITGAYDKD